MTNTALPYRWDELIPGRYEVTAAIQDYELTSSAITTVSPNTTTNVLLQFTPRRSRVLFQISPTNAAPTIYLDGTSLGLAPGPIELDPFVEHTLYFRARGWREHRETVRIPRPGGAFRRTIEMERIQSGLRVSIWSDDPTPPTRGTLIIANSRPREVNLPFETRRIPFEGEVLISLRIEGASEYDVQHVVLRDGHIQQLSFIHRTNPVSFNSQR